MKKQKKNTDKPQSRRTTVADCQEDYRKAQAQRDLNSNRRRFW